MAKPDWDILTDLAHLMGQRFAYADAQGVMDEISQVVPGYAGMQSGTERGRRNSRPGVRTPFGIRTRSHFVYEGTSFVSVGEAGRQWPVLAEDPEVRLPIVWLEPPELPAVDADHPLLLVPEKRLYDDGTLIEKSRILEAWVPPPVVYLNQADADAFGVRDGDPVDVVSTTGNVVLTARVNARVPAGVALISQALQGAELWKLGLDRGLVRGQLRSMKEAVPASGRDS